MQVFKIAHESRWTPKRIGRLLGLLVAILMLTASQAAAAAPVLTWDYGDTTVVAGFKVHYGSSSHAYDHEVAVGLQQSWTLSGLTAGQTYYFAVTAYDAAGQESGYSEEVVCTLPAADSDGDGLTDADEINLYHTDPNRFDSDGDGFSDGVEVGQGFDPRSAASKPGPDLTSTVYEDAEDGATTPWFVYDGDAATAGLQNVYDDQRGSRVIQVNGIGIDHGFALARSDRNPWHNAWEPVAQWSMKVSGEFVIYLDVDTSAGHRYLYYTPTDHNDLGDGEYVHHGLGADTGSGEWYTFVRDLQADLEEAQPGVMILEVNGFLVRGSCRLDDIQLHSDLPGPRDSDGDGLADDDETSLYGTDPQRKDSDGDGVGDGYEIQAGSDPTDASSRPGPTETVYEDAEDKTTQRWFIYDNVSKKAKVTNVYDKTASSQVIKLQGKSLNDGFRLAKADGSAWHNTRQTIVSWSMKYSQPFTIYLDVATSAGHRYLYYGADNEDRLDEGEYIHHGIGTDAANGAWKTVTRDLAQDLEEAQPGVKILEVNGFLVRGSGQIDNVKLMAE